MSKGIFSYLAFLADIKTDIHNNTGGMVDQIGQRDESYPLDDTANAGLNGRLVRVAQNLTRIYNVVAGWTSRAPLPTQTPGAVNTELRAGKLFIARVPIAAVAGKFASAQLYNPVGSGKVLTLINGAVYSSTAAIQQCYKKDTTLATEVVGVVAAAKIGGGGTVAKIYKEDLAAVGAPTEFFGYVASVASQPGSVMLSSSMMIDIPEGHGVVSEIMTANLTCAFTFFFTERDA
jgi:hypothetical protein